MHLLLALFHYHSPSTLNGFLASCLGLQTVNMDKDMDADFNSFEFDRLVETKNCLLRVLSVAEEQHGTIEALAVAEDNTEGIDFSNCRGTLSLLRANASSNERLSSRVDKHLNELRERVFAHRETTLNQRLALLTILSAVFMPLTLLSGIWGMNFENMPEVRNGLHSLTRSQDSTHTSHSSSDDCMIASRGGRLRDGFTWNVCVGVMHGCRLPSSWMVNL